MGAGDLSGAGDGEGAEGLAVYGVCVRPAGPMPTLPVTLAVVDFAGGGDSAGAGGFGAPPASSLRAAALVRPEARPLRGRSAEYAAAVAGLRPGSRMLKYLCSCIAQCVLYIVEGRAEMGVARQVAIWVPESGSREV